MSVDLSKIKEGDEVWLPAVGMEGVYSVSSLGRVRNDRTQRMVKGCPCPRGYLRVDLRHDKRRARWTIHRLVAMSFLGAPPTPQHTQVAHGDGNPSNNSVHNLRWATPAENVADTYIHGTRAAGSRHPAAKLTEAEVAAIRTLYRPGRAPALAKMLGISPSTARRIAVGVTWSTFDLDLERIP